MRYPATPSRAYWVIGAVGLLLCLTPLGPVTEATAMPTLPPATYIGFVSGLDVPVTAPGTTDSLSGTVHNPLPTVVFQLNLTLEFYAFNAYPGNATGGIPSDASPTFSGPGGAGTAVAFLLGTLQPNASTSISSSIVVPSAAGAGDYAIRLRMSFEANGTGYLLESRGFFTAAEWTNATQLANNASTLNLSRLGVSGVLPETALPVRVNPFPWLLTGVLVAAVGLAALGGYFAIRRGPGSRSGASSAPPRTRAARAFGKRRKSDGD